MINHIIEFSARNRVLIVALTLRLTLYGAWSLRTFRLTQFQISLIRRSSSTPSGQGEVPI